MQCKIAVVCVLIMAGTPLVWANQTAKAAVDELAQPKVKTGMNAIKPDINTMGWIDKNHQGFQDWLQNSAVNIDGWFGENQSTKPAKASLRVMMDTTWNKYDGIKIKPRVRGRIKLPTLENRLSLVFGDDSLDYETRDGALSDDRKVMPNANDHRYDRRETRESNSSLALRWSKFRRNKDIDIDLGVRSNDVYIRAKAEKKWEMPHDITMRFEQMYRYGSHTEHTAVSTLEFTQPQSGHSDLVSRSQLHYTHKGEENLYWHSSLFQRHFVPVKHGKSELNYGLYVGGNIQDKKVYLNTYGPYVGYRQPVWRPWLFLQTDVSYYNSKHDARSHHASIFGRTEVIF